MSPFFQNIKTIAIVGLSTDEQKPSNEVGAYLKSEGFKIIPINPKYAEVLGETSYPNLLSVPKDIKIDVLDIFRKSEDVLPHVKEAIERGDVHTIWMQEGIVNSEAEKLAKDHKLDVIMNFCLMKAHRISSKQ